MSRLPCEQKRIEQPLPADPLCLTYTVLPSTCASPYCERPADEEHHAVPKWFTRSWWTRDWALIDSILVPVKVPLCRICHARCTENDARVVWVGQWAWEHGDGTRVLPIQPHTEMRVVLGDADAPNIGPPSRGASASPSTTNPGAPVGDSAVSGSANESPGDPEPPPPGQKCPTCGRRRNKERTADSPRSTVKSFRLPADVKNEFEEILEAAAEHVGGDEAYPKYRAIVTGLALVLQLPAGEKGVA